MESEWCHHVKDTRKGRTLKTAKAREKVLKEESGQALGRLVLLDCTRYRASI